jgi:transposase
MKDSKKIVRRRHSAELKAQVLSECAQRGASVARVALSHGISKRPAIPFLNPAV